MELIKGNDGAIRGAKLRVSSKGRRPVLFSRPVQELFPLEVTQVEPVLEYSVTAQPAADVQRPRREATALGELRRRLIDQCCDDNNDFDLTDS